MVSLIDRFLYMEKHPIKFNCFFSVAVHFYDNLTNTLVYSHFLKNIKPYESEYLIKHIHQLAVSVLVSS